jgi:uncharacterized membrane protein
VGLDKDMKLHIGKLKVERVFLLFSLVFGLLWMVILPPFQAPDEVSHFLRAYMIADGKLMCENVNGSNAGSYFPTAVKTLGDKIGSGQIAFHPKTKQDVHLIKEAFNIKLTNEKTFAELPGACVYNPVPYIPQSLGMFLGKILTNHVLVIFYFGRLFNLLFFTFITYFALKLLPRFKITALLLTLTPMGIHQAASLSADGITISSSFLLISYIFYLANLQKITNKQLLFLGITGIVVTLAKIVYFPIVWLYFIIPIKLIGSKLKYFLSGLIICGVSLIATASWMLYVRSVHVMFPVDPKAQLLWILHNPFSFTYKLLYTLLTEGLPYYNGFFGVFGWLDTVMPTLLAVGFLIFLIFSIFLEQDKEYSEIKSKEYLLKGLWILCLYVISVILIEVTLFLNWSAPDQDEIQGVQGRYFIPVALLFFSSLHYLKPSIQKNWHKILCFGIFLMFVICSYFLYLRYY